MEREAAERYLACLQELLHQVRHHWHREERTGPLSWPQGFILRYLRRHGPTHPHVLAECLGVHRSTVTDLVDVLEERGLVRRAPDPRDRRSLQVALTSAGTDALQAVEAAGRERHLQALMALEPAEAEAVLSALAKWARVWSATAQDPSVGSPEERMDG